MTRRPALRVRNLSVPFGREPGLKGLDLEVAEGERMVVVGASGEGKTTLLKAIAGISPPTGGSVEIGERVVTDVPPERRRAVYLHQDPVLFPHLSVFENVAFPLRIRSVGGGELRRRVGEVLGAVRLEDYADRSPQALSGGQRHRVALARAVVARPTLLLLDEPLASLDPVLRGEVREAIVRLQEEFLPALVLVTHDMEEAGLLGHRIGVLVARRLVQVAAPRELFSRPASVEVARLLGFPNEVPGRRLANGTFRSVLGDVPLEAAMVTPDGPWEGPAVGLLPPGAVRVGPEGALAHPGAGGAAGGKEGTSEGTLRVFGLVERLSHPGARAVARVRMEPEVGKVVRLQADVDPWDLPEVGSPIRLEVDVRRLRVFRM